MERNIKITQMRARNAELLCQNVQFIEQEKVYRAEYDRLHDERESMKDTSERKAAMQLWQILIQHGGNKLTLPDILKPKEVKVKVPSSHAVSDAPISPPVNVIHKCGICMKTSEQHLLVRCDECNKRYHLACLDPPLSRMPKKSKLFGWHCHDCSALTSDDSGEDEDVSAPRRLRDSIKEPRKLLHEHTVALSADIIPRSVSAKRLDDRAKSSSKAESDSERRCMNPNFLLSYSVVQKLAGSKKKSGHRRRRVAMMSYSSFSSGGERTLAPMECAMCLRRGTMNDMVRCDECTLCYHFSCLTPSESKSPRRRGSSWLCDACDPKPKLKPFVKKSRSSPPPSVAERKRTPTRKSPAKQTTEESLSTLPHPGPSKSQTVQPKRSASIAPENTTPSKRTKKTPKKYQDGGTLSDGTRTMKSSPKKKIGGIKKVKVEIESSDSNSDVEGMDRQAKVVGKLEKTQCKKRISDETSSRGSPSLVKSRNALSSILMKKEREQMKKGTDKTVAKSRSK